MTFQMLHYTMHFQFSIFVRIILPPMCEDEKSRISFENFNYVNQNKEWEVNGALFCVGRV